MSVYMLVANIVHHGAYELQPVSRIVGAMLRMDIGFCVGIEVIALPEIVFVAHTLSTEALIKAYSMMIWRVSTHYSA